MNKTLGIDLGTSSLGWAILDSDLLLNEPFNIQGPSLIDCGVIIFPEGMDREKSGGLKSRAATRRAARAARRLIFRRKLRKILLLKALRERGMCPISLESIEAWKQGHYPIHDTGFRAWLAATPEANPYVDRKRAAEEKVSPFELGRALYHIAQRRGFKSSRKEQLMEMEAEEDADAATESQKAREELGKVKKEIRDLTKEMGDLTLGQYFYELYSSGQKVRGRHVGRKEHYEKEFERIASVQGLDPETTLAFRRILFYQRPLRSQSHRVGWCELEKGKKYHRAHVSHPLYESFSAWGFINAFRVKLGDAEPRSLTPEERAAAFDILTCREKVLTADDFLKKLQKKIPALKGAGMTHRAYTRVPTLRTTAQFEAIQIPRDEWQTAFNALIDFDDVEKLANWAKNRYGLDGKNLRKFLLTNPSDERGRFSLYALRKILPWLERGFLNHEAFFFAKLPDAIPDFEAHKEEILADLCAAEQEYREEKLRRSQAKTRPSSPLLPLESGFWKACLIQKWGLTEDGYAKLYLDQECDTENTKLDPIDLESYHNPLVCRALTVLRRLINTLRQEGKIDADTHIHIELTHQVNSSNECLAIEKYQKAQAQKREEARAHLESFFVEAGIHKAVSDDLILRYLLWEEQGRFCPYTGREIGLHDMALHCDIEHTIPRSLGGTSKMENLTLCDPHYNRDIKKGKVPSECPNATEKWKDPANDIDYPVLDQHGTVLDRWKKRLAELEKILRRRPVRGENVELYNQARQKWLQTKMERDYLSAKIGFFTISRQGAEKSSFLPRQLVDTGAMTTRAIDYLKTRYPYVYSTNGTATAYARKAWGLQQKDEEKDRSDHTHHAVDAIITAALSIRAFNQICSYFKNHDSNPVEPTVPPPFPHFGERIHQAVESILVRSLQDNQHRKPYSPTAKRNHVRLANPIRKQFDSGERSSIASVQACGTTVRGTLHDATLYGRITLPGSDETVTVVRKTIAQETDLEKLAQEAVDPAVGKVLMDQIQAYKAEGTPTAKLNTKEYWLNREKNVPLKKIRIRVKKPSNPKPIREQVFGGSTSEHQNVYVSNIPPLEMHGWKNEKGKWKTSITSLLDVARGFASEVTVSSSASHHDAFRLYPGQFVLTYEHSPEELKNLTRVQLGKRLYVVIQTDHDRGAIFRFHTEARSFSTLTAELPKMFDADTHKKLGTYGGSTINFKHPNPQLSLSVSYFAEHMLFEGRDFRFTLTGQIEWIPHD